MARSFEVLSRLRAGRMPAGGGNSDILILDGFRPSLGG